MRILSSPPPSGLLRYALVPFLVTRLAILVAIGAASAWVPLNAAACLGCAPSGIEQLDGLARWDGRWYVDVAQNGYSYDPGQQSSIAFFPLYPALVRLVTLPFGNDRAAIVVGALLVSNVALLAALAALVRLAATELEMPAARRVPMLLLVWPASVFLSAAYPTSLFILLAAVAFLAARRDRWREAGIASALATLTRPFGIAVAAALLIEVARRPRGDRLRPLAWLASAPAAGIAWWAYLTALSGQPWAFLLAQARFRRAPSQPFAAVGELLDPAKYGFPYLVAGLFVLTLILVVVAWRRLRPTLPAYATLVLAFMVASGTLSSSMRYELAMFPILFVVAVSERRVGFAYTAVSTALCLVLSAMFARQFWIG